MTQRAATSAHTDQLKGFDEFLQSTLQEWNIPGLAVAIVKNDAVVNSQGFGTRDIAQQLEDQFNLMAGQLAESMASL